MSKNPNIVYFFCDELQTQAIGCYNNYSIQSHTPNIDELAKTGVKFTNCYCNSPICVPSRTSLLTGLYPNDTGVLCNEAGFSSYDFDNKYITLPEHFQNFVYDTASFGKTHLPLSMNPFLIDNSEGGGMDFIKGYKDDELKLIKPSKFQTMIGGVYPDEKEYQPDKVAKNAIDYIKKTDKPFLLRVSFLQPHTPVVPPKKIVDKFKNMNFSPVDRTLPNTCEFEKRFAEVIGADNLTDEQVRLAKVYYYSMVHWIDIQVGKVMDTLKSMNKLENTIIIFNADHGVSLGENGLYAKHIFAPSVHKVPLIINYKSHKLTTDSNKLCSNIDIGTTLCKLADIPVPEQFKGIDLFSSQKNEYVYSIIGYGEKESCAFPYKNLGRYSDNEGWPMRCCVRTDKYRLDKNIKINGEFVKDDIEDIFFCDCSKHSDEKANMKDMKEYSHVVSDLSKKIDKFINRI